MMYPRDVLHDYERILRNCKIADDDCAEALQAYGQPQTHHDAVKVLVKWIQSDHEMVNDDVLQHLREMVIDMDEPFAFMVDDIAWTLRWYKVDGEGPHMHAMRVLSACTNPELIQKYPAMCLQGIGLMCRYLNPQLEHEKSENAPVPIATKALAQTIRDMHAGMNHPSMIRYLQDYESSDIENLCAYYYYFMHTNDALMDRYVNAQGEEKNIFDHIDLHFHDKSMPQTVAFWANPRLVEELQYALQDYEDTRNSGNMVDLYSQMEHLLLEENTWSMVFQYPDKLIPGCLATLLHTMEHGMSAPGTTGIASIEVWLAEFERHHHRSPVLMDTLVHTLQYYWKTGTNACEYFQTLRDYPTPKCLRVFQICAQFEQWKPLKNMVMEYGASIDEYEDAATPLSIDHDAEH